MKTFLICLLVASVLLMVVNIFLSFLLKDLWDKAGRSHPAYTIEESKSRGAFVAEVEVQPNPIRWKGHNVKIKEAWVEYRTELIRVYALIPFLVHYQFRTEPGYHLCVKLSQDSWDVLWRGDGAFLVREGGRAGFGMKGRAVLWDDLDAADFETIKVLLTDNWHLEHAQPLEFKRVRK